MYFFSRRTDEWKGVYCEAGYFGIYLAKIRPHRLKLNSLHPPVDPKPLYNFGMGRIWVLARWGNPKCHRKVSICSKKALCWTVMIFLQALLHRTRKIGVPTFKGCVQESGKANRERVRIFTREGSKEGV